MVLVLRSAIEIGTVSRNLSNAIMAVNDTLNVVCVRSNILLYCFTIVFTLAIHILLTQSHISSPLR